MNVLIIYYSTNGSTKKMARLIARGVENIDGANAILRTVPNNQKNTDDSDPLVINEDLKDCSALLIGSIIDIKGDAYSFVFLCGWYC